MVMQGESCLQKDHRIKDTGRGQQKEAKGKKSLVSCACHALPAALAATTCMLIGCPARPVHQMSHSAAGAAVTKAPFVFPRFLFSRLNDRTLTPVNLPTLPQALR